MGIEDLGRLTAGELRKVKNVNYLLFHALSAGNLAIFYYSLYSENWILLFLTFGFFIAGLAVYDNYCASRRCLEEAEEREIRNG
jgi:hypothetical protein